MSYGRKKVIGVGGLIGSGKTVVSKIFEKLGAYYISADSLGWEVLEEKKKELKSRFGEMVIRGNDVDRHLLGEIVFSDTTHLRWLNHLIHPRLTKKILKHIKCAPANVVVLDAALLFEWPEVLDIVDYPIWVTANQPLRRRRLAGKKGMTTERFNRISECQKNLSNVKTRARYVIRNNGTINALKGQCCAIYKEIKDDS